MFFYYVCIKSPSTIDKGCIYCIILCTVEVCWGGAQLSVDTFQTMLGHALLLLLLLTLTGTPGKTYGGLYGLKIAMNYFKFWLDNKHVLKT